MVATNGTVSAFSKTGQLEASQTLEKFLGGCGWGVSGCRISEPFVSDPWLVFDPYIDGFWLVAFTCPLNSAGNCISSGSTGHAALLIGLSDSSDATEDWVFFTVDARRNGNRNSGLWCDYPKLGIDAQAVYFTCNMYSPGNNPDFQYAKIRVMTKAQFVSDACCFWWDFWDLREGFLNLFHSFSIQPAIMHNATIADGMFLINAVGGGLFQASGGSGDELKVWRVRNAQRCCIPGNQSSPDFEVKSQTVGSYSTPHDAPQKGSNNKIDTGDATLQYAFWKDGLLSTGQGTTCRSVACVAFTELSVAGYPAIRTVNDFVLNPGGPGALYRYYPRVEVNAQGNKTMVYSASNKTQFVDVRFIGIPPRSTCTKCIDGPETVIQAGLAIYNEHSWGDYSGASADPDGIGIWVHGAFAGGDPTMPKPNTWGTRVALTTPGVIAVASDSRP